MDKDKIISIIGSSAEELLRLLTVPADIEVVVDKDGVYQVALATEESGLLIGFHGETLSSFQLILGLIVSQKVGEWIRLVVEVGDYRARRNEELAQMAKGYADQAVASGQAVFLPYLHPAERRIIHLALQDDHRVLTESEGEGRNRRLVIKPKTQA